VRTTILIANATLLAATAITSVSGTAGADINNPAINGTYIAQSNGEWATTNDIFHDEATIRQTWTITSSCSTPQDCAGTVTSDEGWTADITFRAGDKWRVDRELPNWMHCYDGTAATGIQKYLFWPSSPEGIIDFNSPVLTGWQETTGPSGACGRNQWLFIRSPFKLVPVT
jgi:hypothetical protein